jgi:hypothetical protein
MTDYWPQEEGAIFDANSYILPCYPDDTISELAAVAMGTTSAGRISVEAADAIGDGVGVALKAATGTGAPTRIPVLFYGVVKLSSVATSTVTTGTFCMNNTTTTYSFGASMGLDTDITTLVIGGGASYIMGMALQGHAYSALGDEILVLVGKCI